jgi:hypothetical protein
MIVLTDEQAITVHHLLTCILLNEPYRLTDVEDALVWLSPENRSFVPLTPCGLKTWHRKSSGS